jgi:16S rRNA processing protein RimM
MSPRGLPDDAVLVAKAGRTHGVRGEIRLIPESGDPSRILGLDAAWIVLPGEPPRRLEIESGRVHQDVALVRFGGHASPEEASKLTHAEIWAPASELPSRGGDEFGLEDVLGARLFDGDALVGEVVGLSSGAGRDFLEVEIAGRRELIPAVKDWLVEFDRLGRRIVMRLPAGLLGIEGD